MRSPRWLPLGLVLLASLLAPAASTATPVWLPAAGAAGASSSELQLAYDADGNAIAVWRKSINGADSVWSAVATSGSATFGAAKRLTPTQGSGELPEISDLTLAVDAQGSAVAAWTSKYTTGATPVVYLARRSLGNWEAAQPVSDGTPASSPTVAFQSTGAAFIAYRQWTSDYHQVRVSSVSVASGAITAVQSVAPASAETSEPSLAFDAQGNGVLTWVETAVTFSPPYTGAVTVRAASRAASGSTFTSAKQVYVTYSATIDDLAVALDASGNGTITWGNRTPDGGAPAGVYAATRLLGTTSWPGVALSTTGEEPRLAASNSGGAVVTFVEPAAGAPASSGAIMAAHRPPAYTTFLPAARLSALGEQGTDPSVAAGANGTTVATWIARTGAGDQPRATVKAPSSDHFWAADDLDLAGGSLGAPAVAVGPSGDALALWQPAGAVSTLQRVARLTSTSVSPAPAPAPDPVPQPDPVPAPDPVPEPDPTPEPDPAPSTGGGSTESGGGTQSGGGTAGTGTGAGSGSGSPTPTTPPAWSPASPTTSPVVATGARAPVTSVAQTPAAGWSDPSAGAAGVVDRDLALVPMPSLRSFKVSRSARFKPARSGKGLVTRGSGLELAATGNLPGKLRIVVTSTPKRGRAKNLKPALSLPVDSGTTRFVFTGHLAGQRLRPGRYVLKAVFVDEQGRASNKRVVKFAVKR